MPMMPMRAANSAGHPRLEALCCTPLLGHPEEHPARLESAAALLCASRDPWCSHPSPPCGAPRKPKQHGSRVQGERGTTQHPVCTSSSSNLLKQPLDGLCGSTLQIRPADLLCWHEPTEIKKMKAASSERSIA